MGCKQKLFQLCTSQQSKELAQGVGHSVGFQPFHPCAAGLLTRLLDLYWPWFINRKLQCAGTKWIFQGLQQVYHRPGNQTPASFSVIFVFPFLSCIPACSVPAVLCWEIPSFLSQVCSHVPCLEVHRIRLGVNSACLKTQSSCQTGKPDERKVSQTWERRGKRWVVVVCWAGRLCQNQWVYSVWGVHTWQGTCVCWWESSVG